MTRIMFTDPTETSNGTGEFVFLIANGSGSKYDMFRSV